MVSEIRARDFEAIGFDTLDLREDPRRWSWALDRRMIVSALSAITGATLLLSIATGMMSFHRDPLDALAGRSVGDEAPLDTSWSVEFRVIPDHPLGIELRKLGPDESIRLYEPLD
jgi:hypothetical protein